MTPHLDLAAVASRRLRPLSMAPKFSGLTTSLVRLLSRQEEGRSRLRRSVLPCPASAMIRIWSASSAGARIAPARNGVVTANEP